MSENLENTKESQTEIKPSLSNVFKKTWMLLAWNFVVSLIFSAEFINLIQISHMLWPGEKFHGLQLGAMITARLWLDGLFALFWGRKIDRVKVRKRLFSLTATLTGIIIILNGFAPIGNGDGDYKVWLVIRGFIGIFMSCGGPAIRSLSSDILNKEERSQFFGFNSIIWGGASVFGTILSAYMFQYGYWRQYFFGVGIVYIALASYYYFIFEEPKRGIQEVELNAVLQNDDVIYNYKMDWKTAKKTMLSTTNLMVWGEGLFSALFWGIFDLVLLPYIQSSPRNVSPTSASIFVLVFGLPGSLLGSVLFAKMSDRLGKKDIRNRIKLILISVSTSSIFVYAIFLLPLPHLTEEQGEDLGIIGDYPIFIALGFVLLLGQMIFGLFQINQPPLIQELNLPEAQGTITSLGQLVEIASYGTGPLIAGYLLSTSNNNYLGVINSVIFFIFPGIIMWIIAYFTINKDIATVKGILGERASELKDNSK